MTEESELHLFILWSEARREESRILADIADRFEVVRVVEITWSAEAFSENLTRFYGVLLPAGSYKEEHVGTGPMLVVVVRDRHPRYAPTETSRGIQTVNTNLFEAKSLHREWTGGGHKVHATNSPREFDHDITLLLGRNAREFEDGVFSEYAMDDGGDAISADLAGRGGWISLRHLFHVLGSTVPYAVMRNFDVLPDAYYAGSHGDIDLIVDNVDEAVFVTGARKAFAEDFRVHVAVSVGGDDVMFDFRHIGDGYYDAAWESAMIRDAVSSNGVRTVSPDDHLHGLLYHALIHKREIAPDYVETFRALGPSGLVDDSSRLDQDAALDALGRWMGDRGYRITLPEPSVYFDRRRAASLQRRLPGFHPGPWRLARASRALPSFVPRAARSLRHRARSLAGRVARRVLGRDRVAALRSRIARGG